MARAQTRPFSDPSFGRDAFWEQAAPVLFPRVHWEAAAAEVAAAVALTALVPGATILDPACGPGRTALELARQGFRVTGLDRAPAFLGRAVELAKAEGLSLDVEQGDLRTQGRVATFDAILDLEGAFGLYDDPGDARGALASASLALKPGGSFMTVLRPRHAVPAGVREEGYVAEDGRDLITERFLAAGSDLQAVHWVLYHGDARFEVRFQVRLYEAPELESALATAGFRDVRFFADLGGTPYHEDAPRLVAIARKEAPR